jgi:Flp pilus assembly protein TadG
MTGMIGIKRMSRLVRDESGSELVEFSISIVIVLMLVFGIIDFCRAIYSYHFVSYAAQEAGRYAIVRGADGSINCSTSAPPNFTLSFGCTAASSDIQNYVKSIALPLIDKNSLTVTTTWPGTTPTCTGSCSACSTTNSKGCYVSVNVKYNFAFMLPFLPKSAALTLGSTSNNVILD